MIMADMTPAMNTSDDWALIAAGGFGSRSALQAMEDDYYYGYMRSFFYVGLPTEGFPVLPSPLQDLKSLYFLRLRLSGLLLI